MDGMDYFSSKNSGVQIGYSTELNRQAGFKKGVVEGSVGTTMTIPPAYTASESTETSMKGKLLHSIETKGCDRRISTFANGRHWRGDFFGIVVYWHIA